MSLRHFDGAFSGGEMTPEMYGRIDVAKYQQGVATARNFLCLPHGPAQNRPGTEYVREVKTPANVTRLLPFSYSNTQSLAIEVGAGYFRFHTNGAVLLLSGTPTAWSSATAYTIGALARLGSTNYYCTVAHTNKTPASNPSYWYTLPASGEYEVPNSYAAADVMDIHYTQSADVLTLVHPSYPPQELRRQGAYLWTLAVISFGSTVDPPTGVSASATTGSGSTQYQYVVTAVESFTLTESTSSSTGASSVSVTAITQANPGVFTTATAHGFAVNDYVQHSDAGGMTAINANIYTVVSVPTSTTYTLGTLVTYDLGDWGSSSYLQPLDTTTFPAYTSGGKAFKTTVSGDPLPGVGVAVCNHDRTVTPNKNTVTWTAAANAVRYRVYKLSNGLFGYIGQTSGLTFVDQNITADVSQTPPVKDTVMGSQHNYPSAVCYYEQRRCFAGTNLQPQNIWMTRSGTESNMNYAIPIRDDDRIAFRIAAREASAVKHLVPVTNLLALTPSTEWRISSVTDVLTPSTVNVKPQSFIGANNVSPVVVGSTVLFSQARGGRIREMAYEYRAQGYVTNDLSILAPHLFDATNIVDMAFARAPYPILWCVTAQGKLLGMTYVPEQQISAWHQHDTAGDVIESVCTITETPAGAIAAEDMLYMVVRRSINGASKRYIERLHTRHFETQSDTWFVDCGACNFSSGTYTQSVNTVTCTVVAHGLTTGASKKLQFSNTALNGTYTVTVLTSNTFTVTVTGTSLLGFGTVAVVVSTPVTTISGLTWLEGRTVSILGDGSVHPQQTVISGSVTLAAAATKVIVGLPITADLKTLPVAEQVDSAFAQGRPKNVNKIWLRVVSSSGIYAGPDYTSLVPYKQRTTEAYGSPSALIDDEVEIVLTPAWAANGQVCVRQSDPLPLTITSLTQEVALGG